MGHECREAAALHSSPRAKAPVAAKTSTPARLSGESLAKAFLEPSPSSPPTTVRADFQTPQRYRPRLWSRRRSARAAYFDVPSARCTRRRGLHQHRKTFMVRRLRSSPYRGVLNVLKFREHSHYRNTLKCVSRPAAANGKPQQGSGVFVAEA